MERLVQDYTEPLYKQIFLILRTKILSGQLQPGDQLPTESVLMEQYGVSRTTIRQALDGLVNNGLIYRQSGRGTFVSSTKIEQNIGPMLHLQNGGNRAHDQITKQFLSAEICLVSQGTAEQLEIDTSENLVIVSYLQMIKDECVAVETSHLVSRYCPGILQYDLAQVALYDVLEREYGIRLTHGTYSVQAITATSTLASKLHVDTHSSLLFVERITRSQSGRPIELLKSYYRGTHYVLRTQFQV